MARVKIVTFCWNQTRKRIHRINGSMSRTVNSSNVELEYKKRKFLEGKVRYFKILIKVSLQATPVRNFTRHRLYLHTQLHRVCRNTMIRIHGKRVLTVLAFVMAIFVSFQLGLIWNTRSSFFDIVREQLDGSRAQSVHTYIQINSSVSDVSLFNIRCTFECSYLKLFFVLNVRCSKSQNQGTGYYNIYRQSG